MGGPGQGKGGKAQFGQSSKNFKDTKLDAPLGEGKVVGIYFHRGLPDKTSTEVESAPVVPSTEQEEESEIERQRVPPALREVVRKYFTEWEKEFGKAKKDEGEGASVAGQGQFLWCGHQVQGGDRARLEQHDLAAGDRALQVALRAHVAVSALVVALEICALERRSASAFGF